MTFIFQNAQKTSQKEAKKCHHAKTEERGKEKERGIAEERAISEAPQGVEERREERR